MPGRQACMHHSLRKAELPVSWSVSQAWHQRWPHVLPWRSHTAGTSRWCSAGCHASGRLWPTIMNLSSRQELLASILHPRLLPSIPKLSIWLACYCRNQTPGPPGSVRGCRWWQGGNVGFWSLPDRHISLSARDKEGLAGPNCHIDTDTQQKAVQVVGRVTMLHVVQLLFF